MRADKEMPKLNKMRRKQRVKSSYKVKRCKPSTRKIKTSRVFIS